MKKTNYDRALQILECIIEPGADNFERETKAVKRALDAAEKRGYERAARYYQKLFDNAMKHRNKFLSARLARMVRAGSVRIEQDFLVDGKLFKKQASGADGTTYGYSDMNGAIVLHDNKMVEIP